MHTLPMLALLPNPSQSESLASKIDSIELGSVLDMILNGGPFMIPIGLCSILALGYVVERSLRLSAGQLGSKRFGKEIVGAFKSGGAASAIEKCDQRSKPLGRILRAGLLRVTAPVLEREKAVEDAGQREVKRMTSGLRPLVVIGMLSPLLGLLGTVWGMIESFSQIAVNDGLGKPEHLAGGISQALITTAAGLCVAIPTQAAYYWLRGRIDRFVHRSEDLYMEISEGIVETNEASQ